MMINKIKDYIMSYIKIYTLLDSLFSLLRTLTETNTTKIIEKLEIVIDKTMICWRNLRLSTKMVNIHGIEDHLLDQIKTYNGIRCFIEDFIEQTHQFGMIDEKRTTNMRYREKAVHNHFKNKSISNNGEVKFKIEQVRMQTRRRQNKRKPMDEKSKNEIKRQIHG